MTYIRAVVRTATVWLEEPGNLASRGASHRGVPAAGVASTVIASGGEPARMGFPGLGTALQVADAAVFFEGPGGAVATAPYAGSVWTIGHSTRSLPDLIALLRAHGIARVVDVRRFPRSRRHPQFDADALGRNLPAAGLAYTPAPALGGFRRARPDSDNTGLPDTFRGYADYMQTPDFAHHLDALIAAAPATPTAIMCAEAVPAHCHRSLIADALLARGVEVRHIVGPARADAHVLTAAARLAAGRVSYPGQRTLFDLDG